MGLIHRRTAIALVGSLAAACTSDEWPPPEDEAAEESSGESTGAPIDGAHLVVFEPQSPSIHYIGETVQLLAELHDEYGLVVGFDDIVWTADPLGPAIHVGPEADVELAPGYYDITAAATLEGGDRLETTVGGVRVQSRWSGIYSGQLTLSIALQFMNFPINQTCVSSLDLRVDYDGEDVMMETSNCTMNTLLGVFEATVVLTSEFHNGAGHGTISYDIGGLYSFDLDWTGAFAEDGFLGGFAGTTSLPFIGDADATGTFDAPLATPYLEPG